MGKSKELLLIRYISFFILIGQLLNTDKSLGMISLVFILIFIINNQFRIFYYKNEKIQIISIGIEIVAIVMAQINLGGSIIFYLIGVAIDSCSLKNNVAKYIFEFITLTMIISNVFTESLEERAIYLVLLVILYILLNYISKLYNTKLQAQSLYDKLRVSEEKLIEANNELEGYINSIEELTLLKERNRISREIHDSVGHALSTAMIQLSAMEVLAGKEKSSLKDMAYNLRIFINESFQDVKRAVRELKPDDYESYQGIFRLQEVCNNFEKMSGIKVNTIISKGEWSLSTKQINQLYRIIQEILSNSLRHGKATEVKVYMNFTNDEFIMSFNDNGLGTDEIKCSGLGLKSIKERVEELNGIVDIKSSRGNGFFVKVVIQKEMGVE